eukprot:2377401-Alexandrium_andersonii.AAC.1
MVIAETAAARPSLRSLRGIELGVVRSRLAKLTPADQRLQALALARAVWTQQMLCRVGHVKTEVCPLCSKAVGMLAHL